LPHNATTGWTVAIHRETAGRGAGEPRDASRAERLKLHANEFETVWSGAAETFDGKSKPLVGLIGDGQNAAREVVLF
jgi:hypothetical protein